MTGTHTLAFDVGGSFVKSGVVDAASGRLIVPAQRHPTPAGATPQDVLALLTAIGREAAASGPIGLALPSVVKHGVACTAANIDRRWIGANVQVMLEDALGRPVEVLNDADAAGLAEMRFGAGRGCEGTVIMLTLGTGIGSAIFVDGRLLRNSELGHVEVDGEEAEHRASARVRSELALGWSDWAARLNLVLERYHALLWPDVFVLGGGVIENWGHFGHLLESRARIIPAQFGNDAGIVGAALAAVAQVGP